MLKRKKSWNILSVLTMFIITASAAYSGVPHAAFGRVRYDDGTIPGTISFQAYIQSRPAEILTHVSTGCGYDSVGGQWFVQCGNFPTDWQVSDTLIIEMEDEFQAEGITELILTNSPTDEAQDQILISIFKRIDIQTEPAGIAYRVDQIEYQGAQTFRWEHETNHTLRTSSPQTGEQGIRYLFQQWSNGGSQDQIFITPNNNLQIILTFNTEFYIEIQSPYGQTIEDQWVPQGQQLMLSIDTTLIMEGQTRRIFAGWSGTGQDAYSGSEPNVTFQVQGPIKEVAQWRTQYLLTHSSIPSTGGNISPFLSGSWLNKDTTVTIEAVPNTLAGFVFSKWQGDIQSLDNPIQIQIDSPKQVEAIFTTNDSQPPYVEQIIPPPFTVDIPKNIPLRFSLYDQNFGSGIHFSALTVTINGIPIIIDGEDQTQGDVTIEQINQGYTITYQPHNGFPERMTIETEIHCQDLSSPPNQLDSTFYFHTGNSHVVLSINKVIDENGGLVIDDGTGIQLDIPENTFDRPTPISIHVIDIPPQLPDTMIFYGKGFYISPSGNVMPDIRISLPFETSDLISTGVDHPSLLPVYHYSTSSGIWTRLNVEYQNSSYLFVSVKEFGFIIFAQSDLSAIESDGINSHLAFKLHQNFPNPFNPLTTIPYSIDKSEHIRLRIFDSQGRQVRILLDRFMPAGNYDIVWDGSDETGEIVSSGIYFIALETHEHTERRKVIFNK